MNILIVGRGKGSFQMRGLQLGAAIGARVTSEPSESDWRWAELVVLVKRAGARFADQVHALGLPLVWDALDFWAQPAQNGLSEGAALQLLAGQIAAIRPTLTIGATEAMAKAAGGVFLPHHCWQGLTPTPPREHVQTVAYQGGEVFLGKWRPALEQACAKRGWRFVVNPADLREADILVSLRDGQWDGWMCREWKSGVKIANAFAAGRPIIAQPSAAIREMTYGWPTVEDYEDIDTAFDEWDFADRVWLFDATPFKTYTLETVAADYLKILRNVRATCAA